MLGYVHEIYESISGEGISQGIPTIFVRFAGCSLRCGLTKEKKLWCDTPYALGPKQGKELGIEQILESLSQFPQADKKQILITGGEPLEGENGTKTRALSERIYSYRTSHSLPYPASRIETNGKELIDFSESRVYTLDYKLPGSGMESEMHRENFEILKKRHNILDEIKFVVRDRYDFQRSLEIIGETNTDANILFSAVFEDLDPKELVEWLKIANPPKARLSLQIHKFLWGNQKGV
ncbi:organic radical activating enzyme [Leptospira ryugenii]|uniref:7-carboxy-7-deazaguanine synthase n=1 Tax=Leptospira ryugenii TaxID=1917863 RepID=A0A2P2E3H1_9LEPT|nr:7-carboxy-7-deazaguanine synthase QueE [Leptospira ryugenii]GBF51374.1 organic radical activating enzyme [Leptospira ryugenii]